MLNVLLITTDQHFAGALSCAGNPYVKTPAIDQIAERGIRFEKAYCTNPICVPSRTSYMTGTLPHSNGITYNCSSDSGLLDKERFPCLASHFRGAGYRTGHFGKWHIPAPLTDTEWSGFETIGPKAQNAVDQSIVEPCLAFINDKRSEPYFAVASFVNPHDICQYARILSGISDNMKNGVIIDPPDDPSLLPPLPNNFAPPEGEPSAIRDHYNHPANEKIYPSRTWKGSDDMRWRKYLWAYYRMVELVDQRIGELLEGLQQKENTVILFTSDHGDGLGQHQWNQKTLFYESCVRVPFILASPKFSENRIVDNHTLVQLGTDLFPTLFEAAGIATPEGLPGLSPIASAQRKSKAKSRPFVISQNNLQSRYGEKGEVNGRMLRTDHYKYICFDAGSPREQLFDLQNDPLETNDLKDSARHREVLKKHRELLTGRCQKNADPFGEKFY